MQNVTLILYKICSCLDLKQQNTQNRHTFLFLVPIELLFCSNVVLVALNLSMRLTHFPWKGGGLFNLVLTFLIMSNGRSSVFIPDCTGLAQTIATRSLSCCIISSYLHRKSSTISSNVSLWLKLCASPVNWSLRLRPFIVLFVFSLITFWNYFMKNDWSRSPSQESGQLTCKYGN